jgi:hypothetical protein
MYILLEDSTLGWGLGMDALEVHVNLFWLFSVLKVLYLGNLRVHFQIIEQPKADQ